ncbi:MAG: hypothetical protein CMJ49_04735 [Planctomycetaceae bacterium]|nr:hypothetical protein [Planctomycetaceae bacterium]
MDQDQQTYVRAVSRSLWGLAVQALVAGALLFVGMWSEVAAIQVGAWYAFGGLMIWLCLVVVYQQHRLEQLETMETEQLAQRHGTESSIFETSADDLAVARKRLERLYRWLVPITSLLVAAYLIGIGFWLMVTHVSASAATIGMGEGVDGRVAAVILIGVALGAFLISRYIAGMATVEAWRALRGGAGYLMGASMASFLLGIAMAVTYWAQVAWPLKILAVGLPACMLLVGAEIALNFVLNIYRPRKRDEMPRPAFDSRILSLITQPESIAKTINEAINYQFGFEITRSWFWQLLSRAFISLVGFGLVALLLLSCIVVVEPHEQALITRFGEIRGGPLEPGPHLKWPWPISKAEHHDVQRIRELPIGSKAELLRKDNGALAPILWDRPHTKEKPVNLIVASPISTARTDPSATSDENTTPVSVSLVNAEIVLHYRIEDLKTYVENQVNAEATLSVLAESEVTRYLLAHDIDQLISLERIGADEQLRQNINRRAEEKKLGVSVVNVLLPSIHPPQKVAGEFHAAVQARRELKIAVELAETEAIRTLVAAAGSAEQARMIVRQIEDLDDLKRQSASAEAIADKDQQIKTLIESAGGAASVRIAEARAARWEVENAERGRVMRFAAQYDAYRQAPRLYKMRRWLEVLASGMGGARKYMFVGKFDQAILRFDLKDVVGDYEMLMDAEAQ